MSCSPISGRWLREGRVFAEGQFPTWHSERVPGNRGHLWAPDVIRIGHRFFVYYSVSTFGKNTSAIGLAVGESVDPASPFWRWEDRGLVLASREENRFNAIDPAIFRDATNASLWMAFGSFWDGIHLVELKWLVHHIYDREAGGRPRLRMVPLAWDAEGWPIATAGD